MRDDPTRAAGWWSPLAQAFDRATLARRLGLGKRNTCLADRQGRCPGRNTPYYCADCPWSEGPLRDETGG